MHWIVERAPRDEDADPLLCLATGRTNDDMQRLADVLKRRNIPHDLVRKPPFADYLVGMNDENPIEHRIDGPVFAYGSTTLGMVSQKMGWTPGYIDAPEMIEAISHWGAHMLNHDAKTSEIGSMEAPQGAFFIRPDTDGKAFAGTVTSHEGFNEWRSRLLDIDSWTSIPPETMVLYASVKDILAEWRIAVVGGKIAAASQYRKNNRLQLREGAPDDVLRYAQCRIDEWAPRQAFVIDICETPDGFRIVETNSISSAGFYHMNMESYVDAIEKYLIG